MTPARIVLGAVVLTVAMGCATGHERGMAGVPETAIPAFPTSPSTTMAGPTPLGTSVAEREAAASAYRHFWAVAYSLHSYPLTEWPRRLGAVTTEPLLPRLLSALEAQLASGVREYGEVRPRLITVEVRGDVATIFDCQDASGAGEADADTGLPRTVGNARTPIAASMRRGADRQWRVSNAREVASVC